MFEIDLGDSQTEIRYASFGVEPGQIIKITTPAKSRSMFNKIKRNVETMESVEALDAYWCAEDLALDAIHLFDATASDALKEIYEEQRAALMHGAP